MWDQVYIQSLSSEDEKTVFAECGVQKMIVPDGGPQYTSTEFKDFWGNGKLSIESHHQGIPSQMVWQRDVYRHHLTKLWKKGEDMDLALLSYKTTPMSHRLQLPAELLNSRKYKTLLPIRIVPTRLQKSYRQIMDQGKQMQAQLYNRNIRVLPRL